MKFRISLLIGLFFAISSVAFSQTADEIIAKHLKAIGLDNGSTSLKSWHWEGTISQSNGGQSMSIPFKMWYRKPGDVRFDMTVQGMSTTMMKVDTNFYMINPMAGDTKPTKIEDERTLKQVDGQLSGFKQMADGVIGAMQTDGFNFKVETSPDVDGLKVLKLVGSKKDENGKDAEVNIYLDASNYYIYKVQNSVDYQGQKFDQSVIYKNYANNNGFTVPKTMEVYVSGQLQSKIELSNLEANVQIPVDIFKLD